LLADVNSFRMFLAQFVALDKAYTKPGQIVQLRMGEKEARVAVSSPPFSQDINVPVLYKLRGDIPAGTTKLPQFSLSVKACLDLHVEEASAPEFFNLIEGYYSHFFFAPNVVLTGAMALLSASQYPDHESSCCFCECNRNFRMQILVQLPVMIKVVMV